MNFIPYWLWNRDVVDKLADCIALPGVNTTLVITPRGRVIALTGRAVWAHPWLTFARWNASRKGWDATIKPGFIDGMDPAVPLAGQSVDLVENPIIPINAFRAVGGEGDPIPPFFLALGVRKPENNISINEDTGQVSVDETDRGTPALPPRALWAVDFYLAKARATYQSQVTQVDASGTSGLVVDYSVSYDTSRLDEKGSRTRLQQAPKFPAVHPPTFAERILGTYQDEGEDRQLVSTVFFLSPPNQLDGPPDSTWTPYPAHALFWNLSHAARNLPPPKPPQPIRLQTGLGLGLLDIIGNQELAPLNELSQIILNAANTTSNEGRFWTV